MVNITAYQNYVDALTKKLRIGESFDVVKRPMPLSDGRMCTMFYIDNFVDTQTMERVLEFIIEYRDISKLEYTVPFVELLKTTDTDKAVTKILSGGTAFMMEGMDIMIIIFCRHYPNRSVEEPENEKVLKGPRDGFGESMVVNTILVRRRIRDPNLTFKVISAGKKTKTDIAVSYIDGKVDKKFLDIVIKKLEGIDLESVSFGEQSIAEQLVKTRWYNPFPKVRFTERPDSAAAMLIEGSIVIISDNTPEVLILPTASFDFLQEADDFYLPPFTATYFRIVRLFILILTLYLLPLWYMLIRNPHLIPPGLDFIKVEDTPAIPVIFQIFIVELIIDGLKIASLNTPKALGSSFSVIAGLILGDMAVNIGWFTPEVILYLAIITIANFTQPSYELGYALKFMRLIMLVLTAVFNIWGFAAGAVIVFLLIVSNKTVDGSRGYLYPLIPWNGRAMKRFFVRVRLKDKSSP